MNKLASYAVEIFLSASEATANFKIMRFKRRRAGKDRRLAPGFRAA